MQKYIESFFVFFNEEIPKEIIANAFYAKLSSCVSNKRIRFCLPHEKPIIANYYGMTFAPSGFGKDKVLRTISSFAFEKIDKEIAKEIEKKIKERKKEVHKKAFALFGSDWKKENARQKWLEENFPRDIALVLGESTAEGYAEDRLELSHYDFGSLFFVHNEFLDYLIATEKNKSMLLTLLAEIYDHGDDSAKSLKTEKKIKKQVKGIPNNILVYASHSAMHKNKVHDVLIQRLETQFARRAFLVFVEKIKEKNISFEDYFLKKLENQKIKIDFIDEFFEKFSKIKIGMTYQVLPKSDTHFLFEKYLFENQKKANQEKKEILKIEMLGRAWRTIKLATIIHAFEHPEEEQINHESLEQAIAWCDFCGESFKRLMYHKPQSDFEELYEFFENNVSKIVSSSRLRALKIFNNNYFSKLMTEFVDYAQAIAAENGLVFDVIKGERNTKSYCLRPLSEELKK